MLKTPQSSSEAQKSLVPGHSFHPASVFGIVIYRFHWEFYRILLFSCYLVQDLFAVIKNETNQPMETNQMTHPTFASNVVISAL